VERRIEHLLFAARWLLAPVYLGLAIVLGIIAVHFWHELVVLLWRIMHVEEHDLVLAVLSFVDIALVAGLVVMVMLSGYENSSRSSTSRTPTRASPGLASSMPAR
jgi:uncharacterized protein (TIGR00645 family)